ncbi:unnamed protein product [Closterium sp. NIES-65]|nr:unnamed protein product [Closterium sp. NIES-65]
MPLSVHASAQSGFTEESPEGSHNSGDDGGSTAATKPKELEVEWLEASQIRFSQPTICEAFSRPPAKAVSDAAPEHKSYARVAAAAPRSNKYTVFDAVRDLYSGASKVEDFPPIRVVEQDGLLFSLDNRRLYELFQKLTCTGMGDARGKAVEVLTEEEARKLGRVLQLEQHVLKWSVDDIMNDYLVFRKVRPIPDAFPNVRSYLSAFRWPMVEECRASLKSGLSQLSASTPIPIDIHKVERLDGYVAGVDDYDDEKEGKEIGNYMAHKDLFGRDLHGEEDIYGGSSFEGARRVRKPVKVHSDTGRFGAGGSVSEQVKLKPTDVVLFYTVAPTDYTDLLCSGVLYLLGVLIPDRNMTKALPLPEEDVAQGGGGGDGSSLYFKAKIFLPKDSPESRGLEGALVQKKSGKGDGGVEGGEEGGGTQEVAWYVTPVDTFPMPHRIWDALHASLGQEEWNESGESKRDRTMRMVLEEVLCSESGSGRRGRAKRSTEEEREQFLSMLPPAISIAPDVVPELMQAVRDFCHARGLNQPQRTAILACLRGFLSVAASPNATAYSDSASPFFSPNIPSSSLFSSFSSPLDDSASRRLLQLVQGPPGTGKTHTISILLSVMLALGVRTLVCAPTNVAIAEVGRRVLHLALSSDPSSHFAGYCRARQQQCYGWPDRKAFARHGRLRVEDIALVANEERLEIDPELEMILVGSERKESGGQRRTLSGRIGRLIGAVSSLFDWKASFQSLISFLESSWEDLNGEFQTELRAEEKRRCREDAPAPDEDDEQGEVRKGGSSKKDPKNVDPLPTLVTHFQKRIDLLTQPAMEAAVNLAEDLPSALLPENQRLLLLQAFDLMAALPAYSTPSLSGAPTFATVAAACIEYAKLVLSTVSSSARPLLRLSSPFPLLLLDEAAQLVEAESLVALQTKGLRYAVLVGDPKQLPATILSKVAVESHYNRSLFERLQSNGWEVHMLSVQYRMHPEISCFPSHRFYEGRIEDGANVCHPSHCPQHLERLFGPYMFMHVRGKEERDVGKAGEGGSRSIANSVEAAVVLALLKRLSDGAPYSCALHCNILLCLPLLLCAFLSFASSASMMCQIQLLLLLLVLQPRLINSSVTPPATRSSPPTPARTACKGIAAAAAAAGARAPPLKVGLISPYNLQVDYLKRALESQSWAHLVVEVKSVDGFEGQERDVIIVTTVCSNDAGSIGFVSDARQWVVGVGLNVAVTRARYSMWVVGDRDTLQRGDTTWEHLLEDAQQRGCLVDAPSDVKLRRVVERRQMELGEVEQLLLPNSGLWDSLIWEATFSVEFQRNMQQLRSLDVINAHKNHLLVLHIPTSQQSHELLFLLCFVPSPLSSALP